MKKILYATCAALLPSFYTAQAQNLGDELLSVFNNRNETTWARYNQEAARNDTQKLLQATNTASLFLFPAGDLGNAYEFGKKGIPFNSKSLGLWEPYCYYALMETMVKMGLDFPQYRAAVSQHVGDFKEEFRVSNHTTLIQHAATVGMGTRDATVGFLQILGRMNSEKFKAFEQAAGTMATIVKAIESPTTLKEVETILGGAAGTLETLGSLLKKAQTTNDKFVETQVTGMLTSVNAVIEKLKKSKETAENTKALVTLANQVSKETNNAVLTINEAAKATKAFYPVRMIGKAADFLSGDIIYQATDLLSLANTALTLSNEEGRGQYWQRLQGTSIVPTSFSDYLSGIFSRLAPLSPTRAVTRTLAWFGGKVTPQASVTHQLQALHGGTFSGAFTFPAATLGLRWGYNQFFSEETSKVLAQATTAAGAWYLGYAPITIAFDVAYNAALDPEATWTGIKNIAGSTYNVAAWGTSTVYETMMSATAGVRQGVAPHTPNTPSTETASTPDL